MSELKAQKSPRPLLAHVAAADFIGRDAELARLLTHLHKPQNGPLLLLSAPAVGASELLRQVYDGLFTDATGPMPCYFAWSRQLDRNAGAAARRFLQTLLSQWVAFYQRDAGLCHALLSAREIVELAPLADQDWLERYLASVEQARIASDETALVQLCLSVARRVRAHGTPLCLLFDDLDAAETLSDEVPLAAWLSEMLARAGAPSVSTVARRRLGENLTLREAVTMHLGPLDESAATALLERQAQLAGVALNAEMCAVLTAQLQCSPLFMDALTQAARLAQKPLTSLRSCQELYARELLGGRISRYFDSLWHTLAPAPATTRTLLHLLYENTLRGQRKAATESWRKRLGLADAPFYRLLPGLHAREWVVVSGNQVELEHVPCVWFDYLAARYRLEIEAAPRALVLADTLAELLKRAPQNMQRLYRRAHTPPLRAALTQFDGQQIPASLLQAQLFQDLYEDFEPEEIGPALASENERLTLPQMVYVAGSASYQTAWQLGNFNTSNNISDYEGRHAAEHCFVAHGFEDGRYTDADEVIWIAAYLPSKNAVKRETVKLWHEGLRRFALSLGLDVAHWWLLCPSGFAPEARAYLNEYNIYGSNAQQFEHLQAYLALTPTAAAWPSESYDFELAIPMTEESELVAVQALEEIARRVAIPTATLNQIKTALVEACINAAEHSLSPERKIYQQFKITPEALTITVSSRGIALPHLRGTALTVAPTPRTDNGANTERRGWGLQLIRTLMDDVVFERADDGTRLRMTKYFQPPKHSADVPPQ